MKKKNYILLPVMAAILLTSCQLDHFGGFARSPKINLMVNGKPLSKAGTGDGELLFSVPFENDNGASYVLNAYLSDFDGMPITKGAPVTTGNIGTIYGKFKTSVLKDGAVYVDSEGQSMADITAEYDDSDSSNPFWKLLGCEQDAYYWPEDDSGITFCSYAPVELEYGTMTTPVWDAANGTASFSYTMPDPQTEPDEYGYYNDAYNQPDILFAYDADQKKDSHTEGDISYAHITFRHALAALRFTRGVTLDDCLIRDVVLKNFYSKGNAVFDVSSEPMFTWTGTSDPKTFRETFNYDITGVARATGDGNAGGFLDLTEEGVSTFLLIPQVLPDNATICIYVNGRIHPLEFCIGTPGTGDDAKDARLKDWSRYAGKVLTLRVEAEKMNYVQIAVDDHCWSLTKSDVHIRNVGTHGVFLRAALVANVVNNDGAHLAPVDIADITEDTDFTLASDWSTYWAYDSTDGFYYYKYVLPAGKYTSCDIFDSYDVHDSNIIDKELTVKFDVLVQAVDAQTEAGEFSTDVLGSGYAGWPSDRISFSTTAMGVDTK